MSNERLSELGGQKKEQGKFLLVLGDLILLITPLMKYFNMERDSRLIFTEEEIRILNQIFPLRDIIIFNDIINDKECKTIEVLSLDASERLVDDHYYFRKNEQVRKVLEKYGLEITPYNQENTYTISYNPKNHNNIL